MHTLQVQMPSDLTNKSDLRRNESTSKRSVPLNNNPIFDKYVNYMSDRHVDNKYLINKRIKEDNCHNVNGSNSFCGSSIDTNPPTENAEIKLDNIAIHRMYQINSRIGQ